MACAKQSVVLGDATPPLTGPWKLHTGAQHGNALRSSMS
jgi:hypothetical protein